MKKIIKDVQMGYRSLKDKNPLVHCITNYVTVNDCANVILAVGGYPTMANDINEVYEVASKAKALVINLGTLDYSKIESIILAGKAANKAGVPIVLDPVGVSATSSRKKVVFKLLQEIKFSVIRGNMAEIKTICGMEVISPKGVDSIEEVTKTEAMEIAKNLSKKLATVVAVTGVRDYISDGEKCIIIYNGNEMLTKVTGTGCMTTSLVGAYLGSGRNPLICAVAGVLTMGIAGERAFEHLKDGEGSGSYRVNLIDAVYNLKEEDFEKRGMIDE